jgi:hypothetical protein
LIGSPWISNGRDQSSGQRWTNAGAIIEPPACLAGSMPSRDHTIELQNLFLDPAQLSTKGRETGTGYLRNSPVGWIGNDVEQLLDAVASDRCHDPKLGKTSVRSGANTQRLVSLMSCGEGLEELFRHAAIRLSRSSMAPLAR